MHIKLRLIDLPRRRYLLGIYRPSIEKNNNSKKKKKNQKIVKTSSVQARPCDSYQQQGRTYMEGQGRTYMGSSLKYSYDTSKEDEAEEELLLFQ